MQSRFPNIDFYFFFCSKREDSELENSNEDSDDSLGAEESQQTKTKKAINKGRWSKEEVCLISSKNIIFF